MMKLIQAVLIPALFANAAKVATRSKAFLKAAKGNPCPDGLENRFPSTLEPSYNISQDSGVSPLDGIWDTAKLREAMAKDPEWKVGAYWLLQATFYSDSDKDREFGMAGPNGGFLNIVVPAGDQDGVPLKATAMVSQDADRLEYQYVGVPGAADDVWTSGKIYMTNICLAPQSCDLYTCPDRCSKLTGKLGHSEAQCCVDKLCEDEQVQCPPSQYKKHENYSAGKVGHDIASCCTPIHCPANLCENMTKYQDRGDIGILGSTPEDCCEERLCATHSCGDVRSFSKLPIYIDGNESDPRLGSTNDECCAALLCIDFAGCEPATDYRKKADAAQINGSDRDTCCDVLKCEDITCPNNTKWRPGPNDSVAVGSTVEQCCKALWCSEHACANESMELLVNPSHRQGSTDEECCEKKSCVKWSCSDPTRWVKRPDQLSSTNTDRKGWSDEECCDKVYCLAELCDPSTMWRPKDGASEMKIQGSSIDQCCDKIFCEDFVCDTDENHTGFGTAWYKKKDTNTYKWQGSTNEECCHPIYCSQFETEHDTRWKRKKDVGLRGSTEIECYDKRLCSDYCCADDDKVLIPHAEKHQGSTDQECCMPRQDRALDWHSA